MPSPISPKDPQYPHTCQRCGRPITPGQYCPHCADHLAAAAWARNILVDPAAVILDTETTGLDANAEIVEISMINIEGETLLDTLVKPKGRIPLAASRIHGITATDVMTAPAWPQIHSQVGDMLRVASRIVIYNAAYDLRLLQQTQTLYNLPPFGIDRSRFACAMQWYAQFVGEWSARRHRYRWPALDGNHRARGDCLACLDIIKKMAADKGG